MNETQVKYSELQKKHAGKLVALDKEEHTILATATSFPALINKLNQLSIDPQDCVYIGPITEYGTISI